MSWLTAGGRPITTADLLVSTALQPANIHAPQLKADKGLKGGSCNRTACQKPGANYWNIGTRAYYCHVCADAINDACYPQVICLAPGATGYPK